MCHQVAEGLDAGDAGGTTPVVRNWCVRTRVLTANPNSVGIVTSSAISSEIFGEDLTF
jgi:hypothetical protein